MTPVMWAGAAGVVVGVFLWLIHEGHTRLMRARMWLSEQRFDDLNRKRVG